MQLKDHNIPEKMLINLLPYKLTNESIFLDIGSGGGQVVMLASALPGCRSHGIEYAQSRVDAANDFMKVVLSKSEVPLAFARLVSFETGDAAQSNEAFVVDGVHATHIICNNRVFHIDNT